MVQLLGLPAMAAILMTVAWISTLGASPWVIATGLLIGLADFALVLQARQMA